MAENRVTRVTSPAYLTALTVGFVAAGMFADRLAPRIPVRKQSDKYRVFGKNNLVERKADWAPGTIPNAIETRWSSATYFADIFKLRTLLLDAERANNGTPAEGGIDIEGTYTQNVTQAIAIAREKRVATLFTTAANYPAGHVLAKAGGAEWNVVGGEQIMTDLIAQIGKVADSAMVPRSSISVAVPEPVFRTALMRNTAILDAIKYSARGIVTEELLAALLGVKEVFIVQSMTAGSGAEIAGADVLSGYTATYLWGDTVWVGVIGEGQNDMVPSFARSFNWTAATGGVPRNTRVYRTADEGQEGDWIEVAEAIDEKIIFSGAGAIITNTLSTI